MSQHDMMTERDAHQLADAAFLIGVFIGMALGAILCALVIT